MTTLIISSRPFSLKDQRMIRTDHGQHLFSATRTGIFRREFQVVDGFDKPLVTLRPEPWRAVPTWQVRNLFEHWAIRRRRKSFQRFYWVEGGEHDGVILEGGGHDTRFTIHRDDHIIAEALEKRFSPTGAIAMKLRDDTPANRLLTGIAGIIISKEKQDQRHDL